MTEQLKSCFTLLEITTWEDVKYVGAKSRGMHRLIFLIMIKKVLYRVCKISGYGVYPWSGKIIPQYLRLYKDLHYHIMSSNQSNRGEWILLLFCFGLLYSLNRNHILSAPVDNQYHMSIEIDQNMASIIASIQSQLPNTVNLQAPLLAASITKWPFEPHIKSMYILSMEISSNSAASHRKKTR